MRFKQFVSMSSGLANMTNTVPQHCIVIVIVSASDSFTIMALYKFTYLLTYLLTY